MNKGLPRVSIVIPAFNEERYVATCIESVLASNYPKNLMEVLVVDNGSTDNTQKIVGGYSVKLLIYPDVNVGAVRNYGAKKSIGDIVVFLDADCLVEPDWISNGVEKILKEESLVIGGQYLIRENPSWCEKYWILDSSRKIIYLTTLVGGCIFIRKKDFDLVDGFDENLRSGEDSDLTIKLINKGRVVKIDPELSVIHLGFPTTIKEFIKRQIWHSSDYITNLPESLKDKVFILTLIFIFGFLIVITSTILLKPLWLMSGLLISLFPAVILSIKRIIRSKFKIDSATSLLQIIILDILYLTGRTFGTFKSFVYWIKP